MVYIIKYKSKLYKIIEISTEIFSIINSISIIENSKNLTIGNSAFKSSDQILTIPTSIFKNSYVKNIKIECSKLLTISNKSFYHSQINSFEATSDQIEIGDECFSSFYLQKLIINCAKLKIGKSCFINCSSLSEISLKGLKQIKIGTSTFNGCKFLKKICISAEYLELSDFNFIDTNQLQSIELNCKEKLTISQHSFDNCTSLTTLVIKNESNEDLIISKDIFNNCKSLILMHAKV